MESRFISVIIPSLNRAQAVVDVVGDFLKQDYPAFEVIVVDQRKEESARLAEIARHDPRLRVIRTEIVGTCHARNLGVEAAEGEIVLFSDDDNRIERRYFLTSHAKAYDDPSIGGVGGRVVDKNVNLNREQSGPVCTVTKTGRIYPNATSRQRQFINAPRGGNMSFRKEVVRQVGGFDETFRGNAMREETDFSLRVVRAGWKILYEPEAENVHLALPAGTRSVDRLAWYEDFFFNEMMFFRKHFPGRYLPFLFFRKLRPILACIGYYGRFRPRAFQAVWRGFEGGLKAARPASGGGKPRMGWWAAALVYIVLAGAAIGYFGLIGFIAAVAGALGIVACIAIFRQPVVGVLLIAFFLPFERIGSVEVGSFTLRISQVLVAATLLAYLVRLLRRAQTFRPFPILVPLLLFFTANLLSFTQAVNLPRALTVFGFTVFTATVAFLVSQFIRSERDLHRLVTILFITATLVSIFGLFQFVGDLIGLPTSITGLRDLYTKEVFGFPRVQSTMLEPLYFGNFLLLPIAFALAFLFSKRSPFSWYALVPLLGMFVVNLVLTLSRGAYLAAIVTTVIILGLSVRRLFSPIRIAAILIILVGVYVGVTRVFNLTGDVDFYLGRFATQASDFFSGASFADRADTFAAAWQSIKDHPIFGIGTGNFGPSVSDQALVTPEKGWLIVNNEYLEVLAETGILGLLTFLGVLFVLVMRSIRGFLAKADPLLKTYLIATFAAFVGILVQYGTFSILYIMHIWFAIGLLIAAQNLVLKSEQPKV